MAGISGLSCRYGGIAALKGVDLAVRDGELVTIIGPNGADRAYVLSTGSVVLEGQAQDLLEDEAIRKAYLG
jgi:ABC-type branched-subunit amino acid transport system ATPase component